MGLFIPPEKRPVTLRIDNDVFDWLKGKFTRGYQTYINGLLRAEMLKEQSREK